MKYNSRLQLYPFLRVALFLIIGIVAGTFLYNKVSIGSCLIALCALYATLFFTRKHCILQSITLWLIIAVTGTTLSIKQRSEAEMVFPDAPIEFQGVVTSRPIVKGKTVRCDLTVTGLTKKPFKIKASFYHDSMATNLRIGNGVSVFSQIRVPENYPNSTFDYRCYLIFHGYCGTTFVFTGNWFKHEAHFDGISRLEITKLRALVFRERLLEQYSNLGLTGEDYAVLSAMTLGDKTAITPELTDDYSISGAAHVLALSGLHLGIIFTVLTFIFSRLRLRLLSLTLVVMAIWAYVFIVGMSPSVMRSAVMLTIYTFVSMINRDNLSLNTLSLAAVILLLCKPLDLYDVSFQMSFISVLFIILLYRPLYNLMPVHWRHKKAINYIWGMACVSIAAQAGTAPLVAFYFNRFSCYFLITNFFVIPMATLILYCAVVLLIVSPVQLLQSCVIKVLFCLVSWLNKGVSSIASLPGASIDGLHLNLLQVFCCYIFIAAFAMLIYFIRRTFWFSRRPLDEYISQRERKR